MTEQRIPIDRRGYVLLKLGFGDRSEVTGYGLEIVSTNGPLNEAGRAGRIYFSNGQDNPDPARPAEPFITTWVGNRDMVRFDRLYYTHPTIAYALGSNPVTVKVFTEPRVAWTDNDPAGMPRQRWLASSPQGGLALAAKGSAGDCATLLLNTGQLEDCYYEDEQFDVRQYWKGMVTATQEFTLNAVSNPTRFDSLRVFCQEWSAIDYTGSADPRMKLFLPSVAAQWVSHFTTSDSTGEAFGLKSIDRSIWPAGRVELHIINAALVASTVHYMIGVQGQN